MRTYDFDMWDDEVEIKLFGEKCLLQMASAEDSMRIGGTTDDPTGKKATETIIEFLVGRFKAAGCKFDTAKIAALPPSKLTAIFQVLTQGEEGRPLPLEKSSTENG